MTFVDNFQAEDFLTISKAIEQSVTDGTNIDRHNKDAAWLRSALSRVYFSVFLLLRDAFLKQKRFAPLIQRKPEDHTEIAKTLDRLPNEFQHFAIFYRNLRRNRDQADYDLPPNFQVKPNIVSISNVQADEIIRNVHLIIQNIP